jgi:NAD(P)-dependent dehydrogenase (short-subunit alcohol dehydrogenase family)
MIRAQAKTVVITGASSGIGLSLVKAFLEEGFNVVGNARGQDRLQSLTRELGSPASFLAVAGDIGKPETATKLFDAALERFSRVHVLVNNAGIFNAKRFVEYSAAEIEALVSTNLNGFVYPSQQAAKHMASHHDGHIINITASIALQPLANVPAVLPILIKGGLNQATKALALELAAQNVKVSAVAPGIIDTPLYPKSMHEFLATLQPVGHIGTTRDIVEAVLYLARAEFTTGVVLPVDGGMSAGRF